MHFLKTEKAKKNKKSFHIITKLQLFAILVLFFIANPVFALTPQEIDQKIKETNDQLLQIKSDKKTLGNQLAEFDNQIYQAQLQIDSTQGSINETSSLIEQTGQQITKAESDIRMQEDIMDEYLRTMYIEGQVSTIELIAKSKNFSEFVDRSEYLGSVQENVQETANKILLLKDSLNQKKNDLETEKAKSEQLKMSQTLQRQAIEGQRGIKDSLLQETKGSETNFQNILTGLYDQRAAISVKNKEVVSVSGSGGGGGGYPYSGSDPNGIDPWGMYYRQCTSYAAWKSSTSGPVPGEIISDWGHGHTANGGDWGALASSHGYTVNYAPTVGSIMSFPYGPGLPYGHVAIVTAVVSDENVSVSEYNWSNPLGYGTRSNVNPKNYGAVFIH